MSGQLVGEVLDARTGHLADLTQAQTLALVAIAEKCHTDSRQGSVRLAHVQAAIGKSPRTAVRTLEQLKDRGLIRVVKRGYKSHGVARANIYELLALTPPRVAQPSDNACATQDGVSTADVVAPTPDVVAPFSDVVTPPLGGTLDGSIDGSLDGSACAREESPTPEPQPSIDDLPEEQSAVNDTASAAAIAVPPHIAALPVALIHWPQNYPEPEPAERCPAHADWDTERDGPVPKCGSCGDRRKAREAWEGERSKWFTRRGDARRAWNTECDDCDDEGWINDPWDELPAPLRCPHAPIWAAWWQHHIAHPRCDTHRGVPLADAIGCPDCDLADRRQAAS
ncbi:hypothetical protein [Mycolicibacterium holsaticum]|uniref:hypothetical protein n=1 Tax=Mycolicibacterium holsaticum TaxID=152142 RepID=UPI001C7E0799|nr:hypothetical protein [Mycolicibacterium holsaticum]MDA4110179.1 hypothetical protein [Mycolicibacterium holsaticum DSM 44478 = JCM 12374]QZA11917.1 hypothetical protein K3U96_22590 [Mycolicibacterium holsaticum DSM 44478 = JCM 12374]UNC10595.1 hypothetical protein H5U41_04225 [Mycolicibacterium holsaticum DSM 44478 = JCM 12374]